MKIKNITSFALSHCILCSTKGYPLYTQLMDHLFGAPGRWNIKRCPRPDCGLGWLDPMPTQEDISIAYKNYYTHLSLNNQDGHKKSFISFLYRYVTTGYLSHKFSYDISDSFLQKLIGRSLIFFPYYRLATERDILSINAQLNGRLLDVGCGSGVFMQRMNSLGWQTQGIDTDSVAIEQAQKKGLQVFLGNLDSQYFASDYFDVITANHVFEHVHDPIGFLKEIYRILRPGGKMILVTPNFNSLGHKFFKKAWRGLEPPRHLFLYSPNSIQSLAKIIGMTKISIHTTAVGASAIYKASRTIAVKDSFSVMDKFNFFERLQAWFFFWIELNLLKVNPYGGEELVLLAEK